jgi:hypothetical protein
MRASRMMSEWVDGLKSPGGALAKSGDSTPGTFGHAIRNTAEGAGVGAAVGILSAMKPGMLTPGMMGVGSLIAAAGAAYTGHRSLSNASVALAALAGHDFAQAKAASAAGTAPAVVAAKTATLAAHGESVGGQMGAEDPLLVYGAKTFAASR